MFPSSPLLWLNCRKRILFSVSNTLIYIYIGSVKVVASLFITFILSAVSFLSFHHCDTVSYFLYWLCTLLSFTNSHHTSSSHKMLVIFLLDCSDCLTPVGKLAAAQLIVYQFKLKAVYFLTLSPLYFSLHSSPEHVTPWTCFIKSINIIYQLASNIYPSVPVAALTGILTRILSYHATTALDMSLAYKNIQHPLWIPWEMLSLITDTEAHEMRKWMHSYVFHLFISTHIHILFPTFLCYLKKFNRKSHAVTKCLGTWQKFGKNKSYCHT